MDYRKIIKEVHTAADQLFERVEADAKARYVNDDIGRLSFEIGFLQATIRSLMIDLEFANSKDQK